MAVSITKIDGDVAVGRNVTAGGRATVRGSARVEHDLRVGGWLDAPNLKSMQKGIFASEAALRIAYPTGRSGWWAAVGTTFPMAIYMPDERGIWTATGTTWSGPGISLDWVEDRFGQTESAIDSAVANLQESIDGVKTDVESVQESVTNARQDFQTALENLTGRRGAADGFAPLDSLGLVPDENLRPGVLSFSGYVSNPSIKPMGINASRPTDRIVYDTVRNCFLIRRSAGLAGGLGRVDKFYITGGDLDEYQNILNKVWQSKLYVCNGDVCYFDGAELVRIPTRPIECADEAELAELAADAPEGQQFYIPEMD